MALKIVLADFSCGVGCVECDFNPPSALQTIRTAPVRYDPIDWAAIAIGRDSVIGDWMGVSEKGWSAEAKRNSRTLFNAPSLCLLVLVLKVLSFVTLLVSGSLGHPGLRRFVKAVSVFNSGFSCIQAKIQPGFWVIIDITDAELCSSPCSQLRRTLKDVVSRLATRYSKKSWVKSAGRTTAAGPQGVSVRMNGKRCVFYRPPSTWPLWVQRL